MKIIAKVYLKKRKIKIFVIQNLQNRVFSIESTPGYEFILERSHSGLVRTLGKGVWGNSPGVRISLSPP